MKSLEQRFRFRKFIDANIYIADYSGIRDTEEAWEAVMHSLRLIRKQPHNSIYAFSDFTNTLFDISLMNRIRKVLPEFAPFMKAQAYYGLGPMQRVTYNNVARVLRHPTKAVATQEEGMRFLLERFRADKQK